MPGVTFEAFDVVVVPFPFTDRRAAKRRPALIVSSTEFNEAHAECILTMVTSARSDWPSDVSLRNWREAGLNVPCKVRLKLFTLENRLILRKLGALSRHDAQALRNRLSRVLAVA